MSLRDQVVEAMALIAHNKSPKCYEGFGDEGDGCACIRKATMQLDAALHVLEANTAAWDDAAHAWAANQDVRDLISAGPRPYVAALQHLAEEG